jgi:hypothetical protein
MIVMKNFFLCTSIVLLAAACSGDQQPNRADLTKAMNAYLDKRGDLCLAKNDWPIDVAKAEFDGGSRNALQMPVLEKLGLVVSSVATVEKNDETGQSTKSTKDSKSTKATKATTEVRRYQLTETGKQFYLAQAPRSQATGNAALARYDFCAARLSLDKVVGWETPHTQGKPGSAETEVTYTYKIVAAPWTNDADIRKVFPMVDRVIRGAGVMQLKETFMLTNRGWEAKDL